MLVLAVGAVVRFARSPQDGRAFLTLSSEREGGAAAEAATVPMPPPVGEVAYTVAPGDTLSAIAARFGTTVENLMAANGISDPDSIFIGQELRLVVTADRDGPSMRTVPDSEVVLGPAYLDFDAGAFVRAQGGPLATYSEAVNGVVLSGPDIVDRVAREFSVGPRVLLAFVEARSGWVTGTRPDEPPAGDDYPAGLVDPARSGLWLQLNWLADRLNGGYYDWKTRDSRLLTLADGTHLRGHEELGPGSFAVQRALALQSSEEQLQGRLQAFDAAYRRLFGDPWDREVATPVVGAVNFPQLALPWRNGETWWLTGGPHGGWASGSAWSALDFVPDDEARGCYVSAGWVTSPADGVVLLAGEDQTWGEGQLWIDIDGDGRRETGPVVYFLHITVDGAVSNGQRVRVGDRLGHPSCEGGVSNATHVHIARLSDGEWIAAAGADPLTLGRWMAVGAPSAYDGGLVDGAGDEREACECREKGLNDVTW
jgi:LysM repeat protein